MVIQQTRPKFGQQNFKIYNSIQIEYQQIHLEMMTKAKILATRMELMVMYLINSTLP